MNYYTDEPEWKWLFHHAIDWQTILRLYYPNPAEDDFESYEEIFEFLEEMISHTGKWAGTKIADRSERLDREGAGTIENGRTIPGEALAQLYKESKEMDIFAMVLPKEHGGLGAPTTLQLILLEQISRGCPASCAQLSFFTGTGEIINRLCPQELRDKFIPQIVKGEISGCMCLTEPGCGSDLGMISTTATVQQDGTYLLNGNKIFITNGGGGVGFVLARTQDAPEGLYGLSLFFVEQEIDGKLNYHITKNEEKMALHGSFTCEVVFENSKAHLLGEENQGFKLMLEFMNEARICVGSQSLGGIEACTAYARKYATERVQFGKPIAELPLLRRVLEDLETERDAIRALFVDTVSHFDIYQHFDLQKRRKKEFSPDEKRLHNKSKMWVRKRTPLIKYYTSEAYTSMSKVAIQVLGGYGFMKEYPVERFHRDSFGPLLYEGTSQIQSLMALKDTLKYIFTKPNKLIYGLCKTHPLLSIVLFRPKHRRKYYAVYYRFKKKLLKLAIKNLRPKGFKIFGVKHWQSIENIEKIMVHAETLCQGLSYIETLRVLYEHIALDPSREKLFCDYLTLVKPRLEAIYCDWKERSS